MHGMVGALATCLATLIVTFQYINGNIGTKTYVIFMILAVPIVITFVVTVTAKGHSRLIK